MHATVYIALCKAPLSFPPHTPGTAMAARIDAAKVQGFSYLVDIVIRAEVNSKLLHRLQSQGVSSLTNSQELEERGGPTRLGLKGSG